METVYVIGTGEPPFKIGYATCINTRLSAIQIGSPRPLRVLATAETISALEYERAIHDALCDHRLMGEWFDCAFAEIITAMTDAGLSPVYDDEQISQAGITASQFQKWLSEMNAPPFYASEDKCARLLGVHPNGLTYMKKNGADKRTALACRALLHRLEPYS